jgi:hypothetical protein
VALRPGAEEMLERMIERLRCGIAKPVVFEVEKEHRAARDPGSLQLEHLLEEQIALAYTAHSHKCGRDAFDAWDVHVARGQVRQWLYRLFLKHAIQR